MLDVFRTPKEQAEHDEQDAARQAEWAAKHPAKAARLSAEAAAKAAQKTAETADDQRPCLRCGAALVSRGIAPLRYGGGVGLSKLILNAWDDAAEGLWPLEVWACPACRTVDLRETRPKNKK